MSALDIALIGLQVKRATSNKLRFIYELPPMPANTLRDGRHFHIGEVTRFFGGGKLVGWISRREFVEIEKNHLATILDGIGFKSIAVFEDHIMKVGPAKGPEKHGLEQDAAAAVEDAREAAAEKAAAAAGYTSKQLAALAAGGAALLGVIAFCLISWRRNRAEPAAAPTVRVSAALDRRGSAHQPTVGATANTATTRAPRTLQPAPRMTPTAPAAPKAHPAAPVATSEMTGRQSSRAPAATSGGAPVADRPVLALPGPDTREASPPRRAPRDLAALIRKPVPA